MKLTEFISDVGRPVAYYPGLKKITKSTTATILLCQLIYWTGKQADPNGWIYKTSAELEEETGLSYEEQKTARKQLVKLGYIEEVYHRLDHRMTYRIIENAINQDWGTSECHVPEQGIATMGNKALPQSLIVSENTTENTTESRMQATPECEPSQDEFTQMQKTVEKVTGLPAFGQESVEAIKQLVTMGANEDDIKAGYNWYLEKGKQFRYYGSIIGAVRTAQAKRLAKPIGKVYQAPPEVGNHPPVITLSPAKRMQTEFEREYGL